MGRGSAVSWVIGAFFLGYVLGGNSVSERVDQPTKPGVSQATKSNRVVSTQTSQNQAKVPKPVSNIKTPQNNISSFVAKTMYVDANRLNVRDGPSIDNKQIWTLKQDEPVTVTGQSGEWLRVTCSRYQGWVFGTYLTPKPSAQPKVANKST